jgi:hypothetical protein
MRVPRIAALLAVAALALSAGCYTPAGYGRAYSDRGYPGSVERRGRVEYVREMVDRRVGDPAGGAIAGALIGGALTGRTGGAILGALFGATASQGVIEQRYYDVHVLFEDGGRQVFTFRGSPPFREGDAVVLTDRGIFRE